MHNKLALPNKYKIEFGEYFTFSNMQTNYHPVYFIPCRVNEDEKVIPFIENSLHFKLDTMSTLPKEEDFFTNTKNSLYELNSMEHIIDHDLDFRTIANEEIDISPRLFVELATKEAAEYGYNDLIVGYLDQEKNLFVQDCYIKDFYKNKPFNILDYYMYITHRRLYLDEDLFDKKIEVSSEYFIDSLSFELRNGDLVDIANKLKMACLEGSFNTGFSKEYEEMNEEILFVLTNFIKDYETSKDLNRVMELCSYFRNLEILEFYVNDKKNGYISMDEILRNQKDSEVLDLSIVIAFNPRLKKMLSDKY